MSSSCETAEIITALVPIVTAVLAAIPAYLVGVRRPSPTEKILQAAATARGAVDTAELAGRRADDLEELGDRREEQ